MDCVSSVLHVPLYSLQWTQKDWRQKNIRNVQIILKLSATVGVCIREDLFLKCAGSLKIVLVVSHDQMTKIIIKQETP